VDGLSASTNEVQYLVLPDPENPYLLARVRWPDVFQAISPVRPDWQDDPGLFDLPYSSCSWPITSERAAAIAVEWGGRLPADDDPGTPRRALMRRMPADWSNLSRAERRAWSIEDAQRATPSAAGPVPTESPDTTPARARRRRRRRGNVWPSAEPATVPTAAAVTNGNGNGNGNGHPPEVGAEVLARSEVVIDLTQANDHVAVTAADE
jgi:hypothetical protein